MKEIIQSLWIGRPLSLIEQLSIASFLQNGHEYHLYSYGPVKNVPAGATLRDAAEILPASEIFCYQQGEGKGSVAAFANLFRYKLLLEKGGWWADTDVVCLHSFNFGRPAVFASEHTRIGVQTTNAVFRLPPGHAVARRCYEEALREDRLKLTWGKTGPHLLDRVVRENGLEHFIEAPEVFCPLDYWKWEMLLQKPHPSEPLFNPDAHAIHLWHELWRRAGLKIEPATGKLQALNLFQRFKRHRSGQPKLTFDDTTSFARLLQKYSVQPKAR